MVKPQSPIRLRFGKAERLTSQRIIAPLFTRGVFVSKYPIRWSYLWVDAGIADLKKVKNAPLLEANTVLVQVVVVVSKRKFKKSHDRQRVKRVMREWYRHEKHRLVEIATQRYQKMQEETNEGDGQETPQRYPLMALSMVYSGDALPQFREDYTSFLKSFERLLHAVAEK